MWDKLLKWGKNPWVWGITIPIGLFVFSRWGDRAAPTGDAQPGGLESGVLPMFITGGLGGGGANMIGGSAALPLGGEIWQPPAVPLSENPDVRIAEIYAGVQQAAIEAQRESALRSSQLASDSITNRPAMQQSAAAADVYAQFKSVSAIDRRTGRSVAPISSVGKIAQGAMNTNDASAISAAYQLSLANRRAQGYNI